MSNSVWRTGILYGSEAASAIARGACRASAVPPMATRDFTDSKGTAWKAWDVTPAHLHPVTRAEAYMEPWAGGWLAFECANEKRRLAAPYPANWAECDLERLELLCKAATVVGAEGDRERTFTSSRGRVWTVKECRCPDGTTVLRFTSGDSVMDLSDYPADWKHLSGAEYAALLLDAAPPRS